MPWCQWPVVVIYEIGNQERRRILTKMASKPKDARRGNAGAGKQCSGRPSV